MSRRGQAPPDPDALRLITDTIDTKIDTLRQATREAHEAIATWREVKRMSEESLRALQEGVKFFERSTQNAFDELAREVVEDSLARQTPLIHEAINGASQNIINQFQELANSLLYGVRRLTEHEINGIPEVALAIAEAISRADAWMMSGRSRKK